MTIRDEADMEKAARTLFERYGCAAKYDEWFMKNEEPEDVVEGYKSGGYVAIIAEK